MKAGLGLTGEDAYLTHEGQLRAALELWDLQSGAVGVTGTCLAIDPSGEWRLNAVMNKDIGDVERSGRLSHAQLASLAMHLQAQDLLGLPRGIQAQEGVNPHTWRLAFGSEARELVGAAGMPLTQLVPTDAAHCHGASRFIAIVLVAEGWTLATPSGTE